MAKAYPLNQVTYYNDYRSMLRDVSEKYGQAPAVTYYSRDGQEHHHSYIQLEQDVAHLGEALCLSGLAGQHIAIVSENSYAWLVAYFGIITSGSVAVCIDIEQSDDTIRAMVAQADCAAVVASQSLSSICAPLMEQGCIQRILTVDPREKAPDLFWAFCQKGAASLDGGGLLYSQVQTDPTATAAIVYTSGTTSTAKPVMLSQKAILTNAADALAFVEAGRRSFGVLPFYHTYGFTLAALVSLMDGINICISGDLKTMIRDLSAFQPHTIIAVPLIAEMIHKMIWASIEEKGKKDQVRTLIKMGKALGRPGMFLPKAIFEGIRNSPIGELNLIMCGGAYLSQQVAEDLLAFGILVLQGYGITECCPLVSVNRNKTANMASVGRPLPHFQIKIKDGEILVRGDSLMNGYYNNPGLTQESLDEGWFKTGDIGYFDKKGHLYITGRTKNLIVMKNGKKIPPEEIENALMALPLVKEVVAYGAASGSSADDVRLAVAVYPDPTMTQGMTSYEILDRLQKEVDQLNQKLPVYKQIQMVHIRESEFEKTASKKIKRQMI